MNRKNRNEQQRRDSQKLNFFHGALLSHSELEPQLPLSTNVTPDSLVISSRFAVEALHMLCDASPGPIFLCDCVIRRANRSVTAVMPTWDLRPKKPQARQNRSIGSLTIKSL